jgi:hypothetical protein
MLSVLTEAGTPSEAISRIRDLLESEERADRYEELIQAIYHQDWSELLEIEGRLCDAATQIHFRRGEGYLLDDRMWLHGRAASYAPVTYARFRRLVF